VQAELDDLRLLCPTGQDIEKHADSALGSHTLWNTSRAACRPLVTAVVRDPPFGTSWGASGRAVQSARERMLCNVCYVTSRRLGAGTPDFSTGSVTSPRRVSGTAVRSVNQPQIRCPENSRQITSWPPGTASAPAALPWPAPSRPCDHGRNTRGPSSPVAPAASQAAIIPGTRKQDPQPAAPTPSAVAGTGV